MAVVNLEVDNGEEPSISFTPAPGINFEGFKLPLPVRRSVAELEGFKAEGNEVIRGEKCGMAACRGCLVTVDRLPDLITGEAYLTTDAMIACDIPNCPLDQPPADSNDRAAVEPRPPVLALRAELPIPQ
jgi:hypothetical protein